MLNKTRSHYKSSPSLVSTSRTKAPGVPFSGNRGRDELEERFLDLRDQHHGLRLEANQAQQEVRILHAKLARLITEKKRYFRHEKTERETALEEQIHDMEQQQQRLIKQNDLLRDRIQLIRVQNSNNKDSIRHRSASAHYRRSIAGPQSGHLSASASHHHQHHHQQTLSSTYTVSASSGGSSAYINHHHHQSRRISSAYANVQSKTDSGLGVYFRPLNIQSNVVRSKSQTDLRPTSSSYSNIPTAISSANQHAKMPLTATMLMHEAKDEIIRLESIVVQQQNLLDSLLSEDGGGDSGDIPEQEREEINGKSGQLPHSNDNNDVRFQLVNKQTNDTTGQSGQQSVGTESQQLTTSNQISYTITTTTSHRTGGGATPGAHNSIVRSGATGLGTSKLSQTNRVSNTHQSSSTRPRQTSTSTNLELETNGGQIKSLPNGIGDDSIQSIDLWNKYQQILHHKESSQRISGDIHLLIERLYRALQEEKQKVVQLKAKLSSRPEYSAVIADRDKQIEILRKENFLLQESLNQFVSQCMSMDDMGSNNKSSVSKNQQTADNTTAAALKERQQIIKTIFAERQKIFEQQIEQLNSKLSATDYMVQEERMRYDSLKHKYDNLEKLNESDQLKIRHLEAKVARLSAIVFTDPDDPNFQQKHRNGQQQQQQQTTQSVPVTPVSNLRGPIFETNIKQSQQQSTSQTDDTKRSKKVVPNNDGSSNSSSSSRGRRSPTQFKSLPFIPNEPTTSSNHLHRKESSESQSESSLDDYQPEEEEEEVQVQIQEPESEEPEEEVEEESNDFVLSSFTGHEISELDNLLNSLPNLDRELN